MRHLNAICDGIILKNRIEKLTSFTETQDLRFTQRLSYHMYTIWLFTYSDLKTIVAPKTAFGILSALSGPALTTNSSPNILSIWRRIFIVAFWTWINLLPFNIDNQRQPKAIQEDSVNKSWRPLPSKRLNGAQARSLMLTIYPLALISSLYIGGTMQCIVLMILGYWYNDHAGADRSCIVRNFINACGFLCYTSGTLEIASGPATILSKPVAYQWLLTIGAVVFTTIHSQDLYDQAGDSLRERWTVPLVIGDSAARWTVAVPIAFWSCFCPIFWRVGFGPQMVTISLGAGIIYRVLWKRSVRDDKRTFRFYNAWIVALYLLPLISILGRSR